jgi:hypothetical protein
MHAARPSKDCSTQPYAPEAASLKGSRIEGSSFSGLFTRVDIAQIQMGSAGNGRRGHEYQARRSGSERNRLGARISGIRS